MDVKMSSDSSGEVSQQVSQLWSMMDDLCQNDPSAYRSFIEKHMKAGADFLSAPELDSCVRTEILEPQRGVLYINICSWKRVPAPQDPSKPLPVCAGKLQTDSNEGRYTVLDVAFNPAVLQESKKGKAEMNQIYMLALRFAQQQHGLITSHQYTIVSRSPTSNPDELHHRLGFLHLSNTSKRPERASQTPAALLEQICLQSERPDEPEAASIICRPVERRNKDLIQVISSTYVQPQMPDYHLEMKTDTAGAPSQVELTVELPKVRTMSQCLLKMSKDDVLLEVEDVYYLLLPFPSTVNEDTAHAIFDKTNRKLTVRVDVS